MLAEPSVAFDVVACTYHFVGWRDVESDLVLAWLRSVSGSRKQFGGNSAAAAGRHMSNAKSTRASRVLQCPTYSRAVDTAAPYSSQDAFDTTQTTRRKSHIEI